jgi:hypothetical protein
MQFLLFPTVNGLNRAVAGRVEPNHDRLSTIIDESHVIAAPLR